MKPMSIIHTIYGWLLVQSKDWDIGLMSRVFANGLRDQGSILGLVIPKTQK